MLIAVGRTTAINSEVSKKQEVLQRRLTNMQRWAEGARKRMRNASKLYTKRCQSTKERATKFYRALNNHQMELVRQGVGDWLVRKTSKEEQARTDRPFESGGLGE